MKDTEIKALVSLLDDEDTQIITQIEEKILSLGTSIIPFLEQEWENNFNPQVQRRIEELTADVEVGRIYEGTVLKLLDFGAIVSVLPGRDGLLHISQIANERVNAVADYLKRERAYVAAAGAELNELSPYRKGLMEQDAD